MNNKEVTRDRCMEGDAKVSLYGGRSPASFFAGRMLCKKCYEKAAKDLHFAADIVVGDSLRLP